MELILLGILALLATLYIYKCRKKQKLPPGPIGLPVFGYYLFLGKDPMTKLHVLAKKYGNVMSMYLGPKYVVIVNDWEATKEALKKTSTLDRSDSVFHDIPYRFGVSGTNGAEWVETRRVTSRAIKEIGLNRVGWEDLLQEETLDLVQRIAAKNGRPLKVWKFFAQSFMSNVISLILGERLHSGDPMRQEFANAVDAIVEFSPSLGMVNFSNTLSKLLQAMGIEKKNRLSEHAKGLAKYVSDTVDAKGRNPVTEADEDSFIGRLREEIENHKKNKTFSYITEDSLKGSSIAVLTGGGETTRTAMIWTLIAMADHPEVQRRVHKELDSVVGKDGVVKWGEQDKVPYTYASLLESMRWKTAVPFVSRRASEDVQIQGYHIPKGTPILFNSWSIHNDTRYWETPERFMPERFLLGNARKVNASPESYNPFSFGKRNCPAKLLALKADFLIFTLFMQKFKVMPKCGEKVEYNTVLGLSYQPRNVELRFISR